MAKTVINVGSVIGSSDQIKRSKKAVNDVKTSVNTLCQQVDSRIKNRNNIAGRFQSIVKDLSSVESKLSRIKSTVENGANKYYTTDTQIQSWRGNVNGKIANHGSVGAGVAGVIAAAPVQPETVESKKTEGASLNKKAKDKWNQASAFSAAAANTISTIKALNGTKNNLTRKRTQDSFAFYGAGIVSKVDEYKEIIQGDGSSKDKMDAAIKWLNEVGKDASKTKDYAEWLSDSSLSYVEPLKDGFDFIKAIDVSNKMVSGVGNYYLGKTTGDVGNMTSGAKDIFGAIASSVKIDLKTEDHLLDFKSGLLVDYGKNMVSNWIESIQSETEVSEVYWNTFANSAVDLFKDTVCNTPTLAIAYRPAQGVAQLFGIDLQAQYEAVSDKKGFAAVTDTFEQMGELFEENASWENWKSGMGVICDGIKGWFK